MTDEFTQGPLYQVQYYEGGGEPVDPFAELRAFHKKFTSGIMVKRKELAGTRSMARLAAVMFGLFAALTLIGVMVSPSGGLVMLLLAFAAVAIATAVRSSHLTGEMEKYGGPPPKSQTRQLYERL
jgi:hypothetical protein